MKAKIQFLLQHVKMIAMIELRAGSTLLGVLTMIWGFWLLLPFDTFSSSPNYLGLSYIGTETIVGATVFLLGIIHVWLFNQTYNKRIRLLSSFIHLILWLFISFTFLFSSAVSTAIPVYFYISLIAALLHVKEYDRG